MGPFSLDLHDKGRRPTAVRAQIRRRSSTRRRRTRRASRSRPRSCARPAERSPATPTGCTTRTPPGCRCTRRAPPSSRSATTSRRCRCPSRSLPARPGERRPAAAAAAARCPRRPTWPAARRTPVGASSTPRATIDWPCCTPPRRGRRVRVAAACPAGSTAGARRARTPASLRRARRTHADGRHPARRARRDALSAFWTARARRSLAELAAFAAPHPGLDVVTAGGSWSCRWPRSTAAQTAAATRPGSSAGRSAGTRCATGSRRTAAEAKREAEARCPRCAESLSRVQTVTRADAVRHAIPGLHRAAGRGTRSPRQARGALAACSSGLRRAGRRVDPASADPDRSSLRRLRCSAVLAGRSRSDPVRSARPWRACGTVACWRARCRPAQWPRGPASRTSCCAGGEPASERGVDRPSPRSLRRWIDLPRHPRAAARRGLRERAAAARRARRSPTTPSARSTAASRARRWPSGWTRPGSTRSTPQRHERAIRRFTDGVAGGPRRTSTVACPPRSLGRGGSTWAAGRSGRRAAAGARPQRGGMSVRALLEQLRRADHPDRCRACW